MKPSEYFYKEFEKIADYNYDKDIDSDEEEIEKKVFKELDKRFIDREELKDKINEIDIWNKNGLKVKKEILELLK